MNDQVSGKVYLPVLMNDWKAAWLGGCSSGRILRGFRDGSEMIENYGGYDDYGDAEGYKKNTNDDAEQG